MNSINTSLPNIDKFRIFKEQTLFEPAWENLKDKRCIYCGLKLKIPLKGKYALCSNSKVHPRTFLIDKSKIF